METFFMLLFGSFVIALCATPFVLPAIIYAHGQQKKMEGTLNALPNFTPALRMNQPDFAASLLLDPESNQFAIGRIKAPARLYAFEQLVAVEVERDGSTLDRTNRGSQLMGAAVGGALFGGLGAIVGGLSGAKRREERIKRLSLKLYTNDLHEPVQEIVFFNHHAGVQPGAPEVKKAAALLDAWYGRFRTILAANAKPQPAMSEPAPVQSQTTFGRRRGLLAEG